MKLAHIDLGKLSVSPANMRSGRKPADITDILPSVRARGVLVPILVRPNGTGETYEVVAGRRRFEAARTVAEESGSDEPLPCAIIAAGDDAAALEASLIENIARLDPDEVTRWESFGRLVRAGRSAEDIASTFGLTELQVRRTLALGNLMPRIRTLYRAGKIDAATVRHLTLASKARQQDWLKLVDDPDGRPPVGAHLKAWLFGGASIPTSAALFNLESYAGDIVSDLFGEERYFANADDFWTAQRAAIDAKVDAYRAAGWGDVVVLGQGETFHAWEHERLPKRKGGRVYVTLSPRGDVAFHEGYVTVKEARKLGKVEPVEKPVRPETSAAITNYVDLHRHAVVRLSLLSQPGTALRLMVAHAIIGSPLWRVQVEPQRPHNPVIGESVESSPAEAAFDLKRRKILALLGRDPEAATVVIGHHWRESLPALFVQLMGLDDDAVLSILAVVMGETLDAGSEVVGLLGVRLGVDIADHWQADDALLDLIKDREVIGAILAEVAGEEVAKANAEATGKVQRRIIRDCLSGSGGREKVERWVPRWMAFPPGVYTDRGGVGVASGDAAPVGAQQPEPHSQTSNDGLAEAA